MIPKRSRFLLSMGSIAFLWLVLLGTVYFNDQVEFNAVEAKWELQEEYFIGSTIQEIVTYENYSFIFSDNTVRLITNGNTTNNSDWATTDRISILNDSIIINDEYTIIFFYDNTNYLGYYGSVDNSNKLGDYPGTGDISSIIPTNANRFAVSIRKTDHPEWVPNQIDFIQFTETDFLYETITTTGIQQDSYQVFENIRNNASTVNPLGFMDTILSFPAQVAGYTRSVLSFFNTPTLDIEMSQQMEENINKWWWPRAIVPIIGGN